MPIETEISNFPLARIVQFKNSDLTFTYNNDCYLKCQPIIDQYSHNEKVDPWGPCYTHDFEIASKMLAKCIKLAPLCQIPVSLFISCFESVSRSNGCAWEEFAYYNDEAKENWKGPGDTPFEGMIFLSGKRTEIHPAVTRYVIPHEYGHIVENSLYKIRYPDSNDGEKQLEEEYAKMRGLDNALSYSAGNHHKMPGEVMANDFRTYVIESETEFWPHEVKPPWKLKRVQRWWDEAIEELKKNA
jgi:hypothetical protein